MTIDWTKPVEHIDGTPLVFAANHSNPDDSGDYFLAREDGAPFTRDQHTVLDGVVVVRPDGSFWHRRDSTTVYVRNRAEPKLAFEPPHLTAYAPTGAVSSVGPSIFALYTGGREVTMGERIRAVIDAIKSDEQLLADVRALLQPAAPTPTDPPLRQRVLFARPSSSCAYITAGKLYRVLDDRVGCYCFEFIDDEGSRIEGYWDGDGAIDGGSWQRVWMDVETEQYYADR